MQGVPRDARCLIVLSTGTDHKRYMRDPLGHGVRVQQVAKKSKCVDEYAQNVGKSVIFIFDWLADPIGMEIWRRFFGVLSPKPHQSDLRDFTADI